MSNKHRGNRVSVVDIKKVPISLYAKAYKVKDIIYYQLMDKRTLMAMASSVEGYDLMKDVAILKGNDISTTISRDELINSYTRMNGKPIRVLGLHYNTTYMAVRPVKEAYRILKIPKNSRFTVSINGKPLPLGSIALFKNSVVPERVITNDIGRREFRSQYIVEQLPDTKKAKSSLYEMGQIKKIQVEQEAAAKKREWNPMLAKQRSQAVAGAVVAGSAGNASAEIDAAPYAVIGRIMKVDPRNGKRFLWGFIYRNTKINSNLGGGPNKQSDKYDNVRGIFNLIKQKQFKNITVGRREDTGKTYFRGIGIRVETLPEYPAERLGIR